ncbi:MAG: VCBS repeat-containing protein [Planctomycetes bacterium]|nr:VCBS repeat-containing protein [Planctomycetota bacterium]
MMTCLLRAPLVGLLLAAAALAAPRGDGSLREFTLERRDVPGSLRWVELRDLDGDGRLDLVYLAVTDGRREMGLYRGRRDGGFEEAPAHRLRLKSDVVLVGLGDLDAAPGVELVLFTPGSVFVYRPFEPAESQRYRRLFAEPLFFAFADPNDAPFWPHVRDLDGDGLEDVCVPGWDGFVMRHQARPAGGQSEFARCGPLHAYINRGHARVADRRLNLSIGFGGERYGGRRSEASSPAGDLMVATVRRMSAPVIADEDGDGRPDLLLLEGDWLRVWPQAPGGVWPESAATEHNVEKVRSLVPRWARTGNVAHADLDGDGKLDFLVRQAVERDVRTRLLLFTGGAAALTGPPVRIFVLEGLTAAPCFRDVDGDGRLDLLVPTYRLDLLERARRAAVSSLEVTLHVFLNRGAARFGLRPDYSRTESLRTDQLAAAGIEPMILLDGDFNRDGRADLLVVDEQDRLRIYLSTETSGGLFRAGGTFTFQDRPAVSVPIEVPRQVRVFDQDQDGVSEVLLLHENAFVLGGWGIGQERGR